MSNDIKVGVVLVTKFCQAGDDKFGGYINYIDRNEAIRNEEIEMYNLYNNYMGNPEKTSGLFTNDKDHLRGEEKIALQDAFSIAQENKSLMWQTVISFDNRWLEQNGLYDTKTHLTDEKKIMEVTRNSMRQMLSKEGLNNAIWSAAIHYNTDNLHVHIATVEPIPTRRMKEYNGEKEYVGMWKEKTLESGKSKIVNQIMDQSKENQLINEIMRDNIIGTMKHTSIAEDRFLVKDFVKLYKKLPDDRRKWAYNMNAMKYLRPEIDAISRSFINRHFKEDYKKLEAVLDRQESKYRIAYGSAKKERNYKAGKISELYVKLGNVILKEALSYSREVLDHIEENASINSIEEEGAINGTNEELEFWGGISGSDIEAENAGAINGTDEEMEFLGGISGSDMDVENVGAINGTTDNNGHQGGDFSDGTNNNNNIFSSASGNSESQGAINGTTGNSDVKNGFNRAKEDPNMQGAIYGTSGSNQNGAVGKHYCQWNKEYKAAKSTLQTETKNDKKVKGLSYLQSFLLMEREANKGNLLAIYDIATYLKNGVGCVADQELSKERYKEALDGFIDLYDQQLNAKEKDKNKFLLDYVPYSIGKIFDQGLTEEENPEKAIEWYERSDSPFALYARGRMYYDGRGVDQDYEMALHLYESSTVNEKDIEMPFVEYEAAKMYRDGIGCDKNDEKSNGYFMDALKNFKHTEVKTHDDKVQFRLGYMYLHGQGTEADEEIGVHYLEKSAHQGNTYSQCTLAQIYLKNKDIEKLDVAIAWLEKSVKGKNLNAMVALGKIYVDKKTKYYDRDRALELFESAAQEGNANGKYQAAKIYLERYKEDRGNHEEDISDLHKAVDYFKQGANGGNEYSQYKLGSIYADKETMYYNIEEALHWLGLAAENENQYAQYRIGKIYADPESEYYNIQEALKWFELSAEQGNPNAHFEAGKAYLNEEIYDSEKAIQYFGKAGALGHQAAQYKMGMMHMNKDSKHYNLDVALLWFEACAGQGNKYAQYKAGCIYLQKGNKKMAQKRFGQAAEQGLECAKWMLSHSKGNDRSGTSVGQAGRIMGNALDQSMRKLKRSMENEYRQAQYEYEHEKGLEYSYER